MQSKALLRLNSNIHPVTIRREGMGYHETAIYPETGAVSSSEQKNCSDGSDFFASATAIRNLATQNPSALNTLKSQLPEEAFPVFRKLITSGEFLTESAFDPILSYCIMKENTQTLSSYMDVSESLARRIINQQNLMQTFSQSVSVLKTRELTQTRIQRALLHIILDIHTVPTQIPFARVLGFRKESSELLSQIKKHSRISLITKLADVQKLQNSEAERILSETVFASNLYEKLLCQKTGKKFYHESQKQIIII